MLTVTQKSETTTFGSAKKIVFRIKAAKTLVVARAFSKSGQHSKAKRMYQASFWYHEKLISLGMVNESLVKDFNEVSFALNINLDKNDLKSAA
ncbi:MAG: hypothetical protein ACK5D5_08905 [Bacteroidota bacterium]|jgi:hypothetical protein